MSDAVRYAIALAFVVVATIAFAMIAEAYGAPRTPVPGIPIVYILYKLGRSLWVSWSA